MTRSARTRRVRWPALALLALATLAALLLAGRGWRLRAEHDLFTWVRERAAVVTLDVEGAGGIRMFLNPADQTITPQILLHGSWESKETLWFTRCVRSGDTVT